MTSVAPAVMAAIIVAMPPGVVAAAEIGRVDRASFPRRQNHAPNDKYDNTCKHQQQDSEMRQSARVHSDLARPRWQLLSKERMDVMAGQGCRREAGGGGMISAISAAIVTSAVVAIMRLIEPLAASNSLTARTFFGRGQNHAPKKKEDGANKYQQQNSDMQPSALGHLDLALLPRLGHQLDSTKRT